MKEQLSPSPDAGCRKRGSITVEMAIVTPLLVFLLFGIIEGGWIARDTLVLASACREAARIASLGRSCSQISACARAAACSLAAGDITVQVECQSSGGGGWTELTDTAEGTNSAMPGGQVRVTLTYPHQLVCGPLMSLFADAGGSTRTIRSTMVAMRE
ncbi:MAG: TadE/TadG family type IV pilus assembly protein [Armatimonadia bacterium]